MKKSPYLSMRRTILGSMILVPLTTFVLILGIGYYYFTNSLETSTINTMKRIVEDHRQMIDSFLSERKSDLEFILLSYSYQYLSSPDNLRNVFDRLQEVSNAFVDLGVFNEQGIHVAYQGPYKLTGKIYRESDWFKEVMRKGYYVSDVFLGFRRVPHFIVAIARQEAGEKWIVRATIDTYIFNDLVEKVRIGKTGEAYLLNTSGVFQTKRRSGGNLMDEDPENIRIPASHEGIRTFIEKDPRGEKFLYATTWLKDKKWLLVVRQQKADAFKALRTASYLIVFITVIGGIVIIGIAMFLTERIVRRMESLDMEKDKLNGQLIRASRLAELGEMAAGFAHEINNPLQIIKNEQALMDMILSELKDEGQLKPSESLAELEDSMRQINIQITRCADITQAILKFGRQREAVPEDLDIKSFIPEIVNMVANKASVNGIELSQEYSTEIPLIRVDSGQLQQVLINLFNNAIDAIIAKHGSKGGKIVISAQPTEDGKVRILVSDNGCGITQENQRKIFSPFYTTKPVGKGTGLGLSVCYGIVDNMGGTIEVESEKGVGTTFMIILPAAA